MNAGRRRRGRCRGPLLAAVVTRLPQLTSPALLLDGDEAVLGLMSLHITQGQAWPWFFYGQTYGLATVEALLGAAVFVVFGAGAVRSSWRCSPCGSPA